MPLKNKMAPARPKAQRQNSKEFPEGETLSARTVGVNGGEDATVGEVLFAEILEALEEYGVEEVSLVADVSVLFSIVSALQLACRHPEFNGLARQIVERFALDVQTRLGSISPVLAGAGAIQEVTMGNRNHDDWRMWAATHHETRDVVTLGATKHMQEYLDNRIQHTFNDAYELGRQAEREDVLARLKRVISP